MRASAVNRVMAAVIIASAATGVATSARADGERFVFVSQGPDADPFWNIIRNGVKDAARELNVKVEYRNPTTGDLTEMARIFQQAVASNPDGMTVGIPDFSLVQPLAKLAADKGIPLITYNSGTSEQSKQLGALIHIGQPEYVAGKLAGERAKGLGVTHFVCVNQAVQSSQSNERCQGFADGLGIKLGDQNLDAGSDPTDIYNRVKAFLASHPDTNGILTLGADVATAVVKLLADNGDAGKYKFITFDLSKDVIQAIRNSTIESAIDQQGYLQGYLSIVLLTKYVRYGVMPANDVYTGPGFVDKHNVDLVAKLAGEYR